MTTTDFLNDIPLDTARQAHSGTSFSPERRGDQEREGYAATLAADYEALLKLTKDKPGMVEVLDSEFARYRAGYLARTLKRLHSQSRCVSWFIAGPSNFPVRRMEKRMAAEHKRTEEVIEFRKRALDAIAKTLCPELRPIMAGDSDAVERLREKLTEVANLQQQMKGINAAHKAFLKDPASLDSCGFSEEIKTRIRTYKPEYSWEPHPIAPFQLTNNGANIRRMQERLEQLEKTKAAPQVEVTGSNARIEDCPADNRVRLFFPGKPSEEVRSRLKSSGFRWSPTIGAWQAYRNYNAIETAKREAGLRPTQSAEAICE